MKQKILLWMPKFLPNIPSVKEVKFFVRPRGGGQPSRDQTQLPSIRIRLRDSKLRATVLSILRSGVNSLKKVEEKGSRRNILNVTMFEIFNPASQIRRAAHRLC